MSHHHDRPDLPKPPPGETPSLRTILYTRSKSDASHDPHRQQQLAGCRHAAAERGLLVVDTIHDTSPAAPINQPSPAWERILRLIESNAVDVVLTFELTNIAREWKDLRDLAAMAQQHHVDFLILDHNGRAVPAITPEVRAWADFLASPHRSRAETFTAPQLRTRRRWRISRGASSTPPENRTNEGGSD